MKKSPLVIAAFAAALAATPTHVVWADSELESVETKPEANSMSEAAFDSLTSSLLEAKPVGWWCEFTQGGKPRPCKPYGGSY